METRGTGAGRRAGRLPAVRQRSRAGHTSAPERSSSPASGRVLTASGTINCSATITDAAGSPWRTSRSRCSTRSSILLTRVGVSPPPTNAAVAPCDPECPRRFRRSREGEPRSAPSGGPLHDERQAPRPMPNRSGNAVQLREAVADGRSAISRDRSRVAAPSRRHTSGYLRRSGAVGRREAAAERDGGGLSLRGECVMIDRVMAASASRTAEFRSAAGITCPCR